MVAVDYEDRPVVSDRSILRLNSSLDGFVGYSLARVGFESKGGLITKTKSYVDSILRDPLGIVEYTSNLWKSF